MAGVRESCLRWVEEGSVPVRDRDLGIATAVSVSAVLSRAVEAVEEGALRRRKNLLVRALAATTATAVAASWRTRLWPLCRRWEDEEGEGNYWYGSREQILPIHSVLVCGCCYYRGRGRALRARVDSRQMLWELFELPPRSPLPALFLEYQQKAWPRHPWSFSRRFLAVVVSRRPIPRVVVMVVSLAPAPTFEEGNGTAHSRPLQ